MVVVLGGAVKRSSAYLATERGTAARCRQSRAPELARVAPELARKGVAAGPAGRSPELSTQCRIQINRVMDRGLLYSEENGIQTAVLFEVMVEVAAAASAMFVRRRPR